MTPRLLICLTLWSLYTTGCLSGTTGKTEHTPTPVEPATPASLGDLHLSLAKPSYSLTEPIPLDMNDSGGKVRSTRAACLRYKQGARSQNWWSKIAWGRSSRPNRRSHSQQKPRL